MTNMREFSLVLCGNTKLKIDVQSFEAGENFAIGQNLRI